ncbi:probable ATP-dependent DNA helicase HFM1 [Acanthaster planci]|uniref:Probable ATP-dependent DNA helicase HFM1 n=1 Tax=Acanthaster planci TaxID=133434 RepID=A0A8B7Y1I7_ACAPL|nr:probable ATP-dependent DNA helicase HFM1 [Acanthaster planci]
MFHSTTHGKQATVRPFIKHKSCAVPLPPSSMDDIFSSQAFQEDCEHGGDDNEISIPASQLIRENNFKVPTASRGILKRSHHTVNRDPLEDSFFGSQSQSLFDRNSQYENPTASDFDDDSDEELFSSQQPVASQQLFSLSDDWIPSSQPVRQRQKFIPSFTPKRVRIADDAVSHRTSNSRLENFENHISQTPALVTESPYSPLDIPGFTTPGGTTCPGSTLRPVNEIPKKYRSVFPFPYFNIVQSKVLDDVLYTDKHMVVCAPTGSGKTAVFELAIVHLLMAMKSSAVKAKIVYMAPIKALCSQRCQDWKDKFEPLGLKCQELTGDTELDDYFQLQEINIVMTTPEKWDSMTRKWRDNKCLVQLVKLFLIDEVHSLNEENRGATVEAVISRMKTVQAAAVREATRKDRKEEEDAPGLRFLAVSATIPNMEDVAAWLETGGKHAVYHRIDECHRPVKLRKVVLSYPCSERQSEFRFDLSLNYRLSGVIHTYSDQKPTLVFCATRKSVQQAAAILVKEARFVMNTKHRQRLQKTTNLIREAKLRETLLHGVGYHHAGLDAQDRKFVEEMFVRGDLPVLFATSTLAMGVNLPAHLVVVKSTQHYVSGMYCEYTETQILQMIGRAGRPQFDISATAVIMTKHENKRKYEALLNGCDHIESSLHNHLIEHLNAEIVLHTISDISIALEWLKSTFLYIRIMKNPFHYGIPVGLSTEQLEKKLQDMCIRNLNLLSNFGLVKMDPETMDLKPLETGRLMARYCIAFDTMKQFSKISGRESIEDLITMLCKCKEFSDIQLRVNERKILNTLNRDKNRVTIRFPMKGKIKSTDMKVNCLVQATLGCLPIQDFGLSQDGTRIFRAGQRLTRCLLEYLTQRNDFQVLLHAAVISKCFRARLWENSKSVARQIDKIGPALGTALVNAGIVNFQRLESTNPRELELILNRHPPFGNQILDAVTHLPKYDVSLEQAPRYSSQSAEITVTITLMNRAKLAEKQTAKRSHGCLLLIGDADNCIVYKQRITDIQLLRGGPWCKRIDVKRANKAEELSINLISQDYVGLDVQNTYTPFYSGPKHLRTMTTDSSYSQSEREPMKNTKQALKRRQPTALTSIPNLDPQWPGNDADQRNEEEDLFEFGFRKPCSHRCSNKDSCAHECCKFGVPTIRQLPASQGLERQLGQGSPTAALPSATSKAPKLSRLEQYFSELRTKTDGLPPTPSVKRIKAAPGNKCSVDLDRFAFTPKSKPSVPTALSSSTSTPNPTPQPNPVTPATPSAKGWEMLDFYQQSRCQEISTDGEDQEELEALGDQIPDQTTLTWPDNLRANTDDANMSWSDSDREEMVLDRYMQDDDGINADELASDDNCWLSNPYEAALASQIQRQPHHSPQQQQHVHIYRPAASRYRQHHHNPGEKQLWSYEESATSHKQQQQFQSRPDSTAVHRRRGQVFAWKSPTISQLQTGEAPVVIPSPPTSFNPPWTSNNEMSMTRGLSSNARYSANDFVSAKTALASWLPSASAQIPSARQSRNNITSFTIDELDKAYKTQHMSYIPQELPTVSHQDEPTVSTEDTPIIVLSDEDTTMDINNSSQPYIMNSSSDEEFLQSCLEVESRKASKARQDTLPPAGSIVTSSQSSTSETSDHKNQWQSPVVAAANNFQGRKCGENQARPVSDTPLSPSSSPEICKPTASRSNQSENSSSGPPTAQSTKKSLNHNLRHSSNACLFSPIISLPRRFVPFDKSSITSSCRNPPHQDPSLSQSLKHSEPNSPECCSTAQNSWHLKSPILTSSLQEFIQKPSLGASPSSPTSSNTTKSLTTELSPAFNSNRPGYSQLTEGPSHPYLNPQTSGIASPKSSSQGSPTHKASSFYQQTSNLTPQPSLAVSLRSPPSSSSGKKLCSPLLRRHKTRDFFTTNPDKSPQGADDAEAIYDKLFEGIFS